MFFHALSIRNVSVFASSGAFYIFLSIVPSIMLVGALLPVSRLDSREFTAIIQVIVPDTVADFIESLIAEVYSSSPAVLSISAVTTLWSASKAMASIMRGIEHISSDGSRDRFIRLRLRAILYSVTVMLSIYLLILVTVFLNILTSRDIIAAGFIKVISPVFLALILAIAYKFIPDKRVPFRELIPGACLAALCWTVFTGAYSIWLNSSNSYGVYGSLASVIITLLWIYFSMYIMLSGAFFNRYIKKRPI